jgi:hypothetical protein
VQVKKREQITKIIQALLNKNRLTGFSETEIKVVIGIVKEVADPRTLDNWFKLLWRLGYYTQTSFNCYDLNPSAIAKLEVKLPIKIDPKQRRLFNA